MKNSYYEDFFDSAGVSKSTWNTAIFDVFRYGLTKIDINKYMFLSGRDPSKLFDLFYSLENLYTDIDAKMDEKERKECEAIYNKLTLDIMTWERKEINSGNLGMNSKGLTETRNRLRADLIGFKVLLYKVMANHGMDIKMESGGTINNILEV